MGEPVQFRWLGVAGSEWKVGEQILAIDPFFTRPPLRNLWFGRVSPNRRLLCEMMPRCDVILVTQSHWDHLLDVPEIALRTGATVLGSPNTCALLGVLGVPRNQIRPIAVGDRLDEYPFQIQVLPATHPSTHVDRLLNGALPPSLRPPLRLRDYRMDTRFSFLLQAAGFRILCGDQPLAADIWLASPWEAQTRYEPLLRAIRPRLVILIHWDNLFRPLCKGIKPMLAPPSWTWPPLHKIDITRFRQELGERAPGTRSLIPEVSRMYSLDDLLGNTDPGRPEDGLHKRQHYPEITDRPDRSY